MVVIIQIFVVVLIAFLAWKVANLLFVRGRSKALRERLLVLCRDDVGRVDRLVQLEHDRTPGIGEAEAYHRAISRLERDLGR